ncbi:MAG: hypothetical protein ACPH9T_11645 [Paracoccaceae bacterium]
MAEEKASKLIKVSTKPRDVKRTVKLDLGFLKQKGKPIRTVIVHDALFDGDMKQAAALQDLLEEYAEGFVDYVKAHNPEVAAKFVIEQTQAAIPFKTERRGLTGSLEEIVFRGSRGKNFNPDRAPIPKDTPAGVKQKLYSYRQFLENKGLAKAKIEIMLEDRKNKLIEQLMENQMRSVGDYGD